MFSTNSYFTIWDKTPIVTQDGREYGYRCRISTSKKEDVNGESKFVQDFGGICKFVGKAYDTMKNITPRARGKILSCGVTTEKGKDEKWYTNFVIFSFEHVMIDAKGEEIPQGSMNIKVEPQPKPMQPQHTTNEPEAEEELPF